MRRYLVSGAIFAILAIAALTSRASHAQDDPLSEPPNVEWSLKDSLTACPAGDSVVAGYHSVDWDGRDAAGRTSQPGIYFYRIEAGVFRDRQRLVRLP